MLPTFHGSTPISALTESSLASVQIHSRGNDHWVYHPLNSGLLGTTGPSHLHPLKITTKSGPSRSSIFFPQNQRFSSDSKEYQLTNLGFEKSSLSFQCRCTANFWCIQPALNSPPQKSSPPLDNKPEGHATILEGRER